MQTQTIKLTGYIARAAFKRKHEQTDRICAKMDDDAIWLECKAKTELRSEAKRLKQINKRKLKRLNK